MLTVGEPRVLRRREPARGARKKSRIDACLHFSQLERHAACVPSAFPAASSGA
jgi:hypothetical protein